MIYNPIEMPYSIKHFCANHRSVNKLIICEDWGQPFEAKLTLS